MKYSAVVPKHIMEKLPECLQTPDNRRFFAAAYKDVCWQASVDMEEVHELDNSYYNMAVYAVARALHEQTGNPEFFNLQYSLEEAVMDDAMIEGIDLETLAASRVYYVPAQLTSHSVAAGIMPESRPVQLPYCDTYQQATQMLTITPSKGFSPSGRYGPNNDPLPDSPNINCIYTVLASPERIKTLNESFDSGLVNMFPNGVINPKTISEVDYIIPADVLHPGKIMHEDVAFEQKPAHDGLRREVDLRLSGMFALQTALSRTNASTRPEIEMYGKDNAAFCTCFSKDGFVAESPFDKTFQERIMQLALRELRSICTAGTLRFAEEMKEGFLTEFQGPTKSFKEMTEGLTRHIQELQKKAELGDVHNVAGVAASAKTIINVIANEKAESLLHLTRPLSQEQREFLKAASGLVPEQLRNEFIIRTADQMQANLSCEAATRLTARAMAREAQNSGSDIIADRMNEAADNAGIQYAMYKDAMEQEEVEV